MPARRANGNTESVDNYLKAILTLGGPEARRVTIKSLAASLTVAPASVTNMLQKLAAASAPMVEYERHRGVALSPAGKRRALEEMCIRDRSTAVAGSAQMAARSSAPPVRAQGSSTDRARSQ